MQRLAVLPAATAGVTVAGRRTLPGAADPSIGCHPRHPLCFGEVLEWTGEHCDRGADTVRYADFVRAIAAAAGLPRPFIVPFPAAPLIAAARLTRHVAALPTIQPEEIRRLVENKAYDITEMRSLLQIEPISLAKGLAATFGRSSDS